MSTTFKNIMIISQYLLKRILTFILRCLQTWKKNGTRKSNNMKRSEKIEKKTKIFLILSYIYYLFINFNNLIIIKFQQLFLKIYKNYKLKNIQVFHKNIFLGTINIFAIIRPTLHHGQGTCYLFLT